MTYVHPFPCTNTYDVIRLSMAKEDGAGRDEANSHQAREFSR